MAGEAALLAADGSCATTGAWKLVNLAAPPLNTGRYEARDEGMREILVAGAAPIMNDGGWLGVN